MQQQNKDPWYTSALRAGLELVAWIGLPIALWPHSAVAAVAVDVLLIGLPSVFQTPGDKPRTVVASPGWVTILLVLAQFAGALTAAWMLFWPWAAVLVTVLTAAACVIEIPRWRRLLNSGQKFL